MSNTKAEYEVIIANYQKDIETLTKQIQKRYMKIHANPNMQTIERLEVYREISILKEMQRDLESSIGAMKIYISEEKDNVKHYNPYWQIGTRAGSERGRKKGTSAL